MREEKMNILMTIDRNYLPPLLVALDSIGKSNKESHIDVYVAHSKLLQEDIDKINETVSEYDINVIPIKLDDDLFDNTPVDDRLSKETFYRLLAFKFLPESVDKCLYLDPDIYVLRSLEPLYNMDMGDNIIGASSHTYSYVEKLNHVRLKMGKNSKYINAGIMMMNIAEMRRYTTVEKIMTYVNDNIQKLYLADQDVINAMFWEKTVDIDEKLYNMDEKTLKRYKKDINYVKENTVIVHYNGKYKPWLEGYKGELDCFYPPVENKGPVPKGKAKARIKSTMNLIKLNKQQKIVVWAALAFWAVCLVLYFRFGRGLLEIVKDPVVFKNYLDGFGGFDRVVFVLIRAAQTVVKFVPAEPLEIGSGYAYGTWGGLLYCMLGSLIGSFVILFLTHVFGKKIVDIFVPTSKLESMALFKDDQKLYSMVFILYLIPGTPKDIFTYFVGLTPIKTVPFMIIASIARIPSIITSTWCGAKLSDKNYLFAAAIFIATALLGVLGGVVYNKISNKNKEKKQISSSNA